MRAKLLQRQPHQAAAPQRKAPMSDDERAYLLEKRRERGLITTDNPKTLKQYEPSLMTKDNPKTRLGENKKYLTGIVHLLPSDSSGHGNVCPNASPECRKHCLNTAGTYGNAPRQINARKWRTELYFNNRPRFMDLMRDAIDALIKRAKKIGYTPAIRINGTSDLPQVAMALAKEYPDLQLYDYTAVPKPWTRTLPNYHVTFSRKENNQQAVEDSLAHGINVAVVFDVKKGKPLPETWEGYPVLDGDLHDLRFLDNEEGEGPFIIGLRAKGKARGKGKETGFSVQVPLGKLVEGIKPAEKDLEPKKAALHKVPHVEYFTEGEMFDLPLGHDED